MLLPFLNNVSSGRPFLLFTDCMNLMSPTPRYCTHTLRPPRRRAHIPRLCDGDNNVRFAEAAGRRGRLIQPGFCQFYRDPEVYFAQDLIESCVARTVLEVHGNRFKPQHSRLIERTGQEAEP